MNEKCKTENPNHKYLATKNARPPGAGGRFKNVTKNNGSSTSFMSSSSLPISVVVVLRRTVCIHQSPSRPSHLISPFQSHAHTKDPTDVRPMSTHPTPPSIRSYPFHAPRKTVPPNNVQTHLDWAPVENLSAAAADRWLATVSPLPSPSLRLQVLPHRLKPPCSTYTTPPPSPSSP